MNDTSRSDLFLPGPRPDAAQMMSCLWKLCGIQKEINGLLCPENHDEDISEPEAVGG